LVAVLIGGCPTTPQVSETEEAVAPIAFGELPIYVSSESGLELSEQQKLEVIEAPRRLIAQPSEHLQQAIRSGISKAFVIDESKEERAEYPYMAIIDYAPITISETQSVEPMVVCEGGGIPPQWVNCFDNSDFFVNLPNHVPIAVNSWTTPEQVLAILAVVDQAQIFTPEDVLITSDDVNHILRRNEDIYAVIASATINLRRVLVDGIESYEVTEYSCR
jgi:hypothetical protein